MAGTRQLSLRALWAFMGPRLRAHPRLLFALGACLAAGLALTLTLPLLLRRFIDIALGETDGSMAAVALGFLVVALAHQVVSVAMSWVATDLSSRTTNQLRSELTDHVLSLDMSFHRRTPPGELIERVDGDVGQLGVLLSNFVPQMAQEALLLVGVLALLFGIDPLLGGALATYAVLAVGVLSRLRHLGVGAWEKSREAAAKATGFQEEALGATEDVRPNGAASHVVALFLGLNRTWFWASNRANALSGATTIAGLSLFGLSQVIALGIGSSLLGAGSITIGTIYLLTQYTAFLSGPIDGFTYRVRYLQQATAAVNRVVDLAGTRSRLIEAPRPRSLPPGALGVDFDNVDFSYEVSEAGEAGEEGATGEPVLTAVDLHVPAGRSLGLVGRTGSGKTTLGRLLARQYDISSGSLRVGGVEVREVGLDELRNRVAVVTQEVQLFTATIRDNVSLFREIPDAELMAVIDEVGLGQWLSTQPEGLASELDPRSLSAGEAQLLALARTLLRDPAVVLLDEASARLDPATEARLQSAVDRLLQGRTAVVIAHRLSTLDRVDFIGVLDHGRVVEFGPRGELTANPASEYSRLLAAYRNEVLA